MANFDLTVPQSQFYASPFKASAFVGGFGSGKSEALFTRLLATKFDFPKNDLAYFAPSYQLIKDIAYPRLGNMLDSLGYPWKLNKADNIITVPNAGKILFRSMDTPERIVGFEVMHSFADELDTLSQDHAQEAWQQIVARTRQNPLTKIPNGYRGPTNKLYVATTPEGYKFVYNAWRKDPSIGYKLFQAPTASNPHLPPDYVDTLRAMYPENLIEAYLKGEFVNLTGNTVYSEFDRRRHHTSRTIRQDEVIHVGCDFNVNNMSAIAHVYDGDDPRAVKEFSKLKDTPNLIVALKELQQKTNSAVIVYPDSTGKKNTSTNASVSDLSLLRQHFVVKAPNSNPQIRDRVLSMNAMFKADRYLVNTDECPDYTNALEQQVYDDYGKPVKNPNNNIDDMNDAGGYFVHSKHKVSRSQFTQQMISNY